KLVKLEQPSGRMTEYAFPYDDANPYHVGAYADEVWIADGGQGGTLVKFDTKDQSFTCYPSPQRGDKARIQITRDGAIWYAPRANSRCASTRASSSAWARLESSCSPRCRSSAACTPTLSAMAFPGSCFAA